MTVGIPNRRLLDQDAIEEIGFHTARGHEQIFEGDIAACLDTIDHTALMSRCDDGSGDKPVLGLVKTFLKAGLLDEMKTFRDAITGTPQGGILGCPGAAGTLLDRMIRGGGFGGD